MNEIENLKVGDLVIVNGNSATSEDMFKVERLTKHQIVVNNRHYWKKDGRLVGGDCWHYGKIRPATENDIEYFNMRKQKGELLQFIRRVPWWELSLESLNTICDIVKKEIGNSAAN